MRHSNNSDNGLLKRDQLHDYQKDAIAFLEREPLDHSALFLDMGLGKTVITLTAIADLQQSGRLGKVLIVGPLRVVRNVWRQEAAKWEHLQHLRFCLLRGNAKERAHLLNQLADIYLINYELYTWLLEHLKSNPPRTGFPFHLTVFDELSKMKRISTKRYKAHKPFTKIKGAVRWGLTGTPTSRSLEDLFGEIFVLDGGKRLGTNFRLFRQRYFYPVDFNGYNWKPFPGTAEKLAAKISDMTIKIDARDVLELPQVVENDIVFELPENVKEIYKQLEKEFFTKLESGEKVDVTNTGSLYMKLRQLASGVLYHDGGYTVLHDEKLDILEDILEEAEGKPILCLTHFRADAERICSRFGAPQFGSGTSEREEQRILEDWSAGKIRLLVGNPASMGHGLDGLQYSGHHVVVFTPDWNREYYDQAIARIARQGQRHRVIVHRILADTPIERAVVESLRKKAATQKDFLALVRSVSR